MEGGEGVEAKRESSYDPYELCAAQEMRREFLRAHPVLQNVENPSYSRWGWGWGDHGPMESCKIWILILTLPQINTPSLWLSASS